MLKTAKTFDELYMDGKGDDQSCKIDTIVILMIPALGISIYFSWLPIHIAFVPCTMMSLVVGN
jgi:hypothetical protein